MLNDRTRHAPPLAAPRRSPVARGPWVRLAAMQRAVLRLAVFQLAVFRLAVLRFAGPLLTISAATIAGCQRSELKLPESIRQKIAESNRVASESKPMTPLPTVPSDGGSSRFTVRPFEDWTMREAAAVALSRIGEPAVPSLVEALKSPDPNMRQQAADTLARIGPAASSAVPALTALLDDPDPRVKKSAVRALGQIGPAAATAVPSLMRALE